MTTTSRAVWPKGLPGRIREIQLVGEIPVSAAGKILKRELRQRLH